MADPEEPPVHKYKLVLIGDHGVGKTCLIARFFEDVFYEEAPSHFKHDRSVKQFDITTESDEKAVLSLDFVEVVKQEDGEFLTIHGNKVPLIEADGIIFIFDLTKKDSFDNIKTWKADVDRHVRTHMFLVGNKTDLGDDRCIVRELAETMAKECGMIKYNEVSAKTGDGVKDVFKAISKYKRVDDKKPPPPPPEPEPRNEGGSKCNIC